MEKIIFENLPSTNTPINAENLNQIQTNVESAINDNTDMLVGNTPTGDIIVNSIRTKNIFNNGVDKKNAYPVVNIGQTVSYNSSSASHTYVKCCYLEAGKTYTFSWNKNTPASTNGRDSVIVDSNNIELENKLLWNNDYESITWTPSHSGYLVLCIDKNSTEFQIEEGDTATTYSPYQQLDYPEINSYVPSRNSTYISNVGYSRVIKIGKIVIFHINANISQNVPSNTTLFSGLPKTSIADRALSVIAFGNNDTVSRVYVEGTELKIDGQLNMTGWCAGQIVYITE